MSSSKLDDLVRYYESKMPIEINILLYLSKRPKIPIPLKELEKGFEKSQSYLSEVSTRLENQELIKSYLKDMQKHLQIVPLGMELLQGLLNIEIREFYRH